MPKHHGFTCAPEELRGLARAALDQARSAGAAGCDCDISESYGLSVTVRKGKPDTVEHNRDRSLGVAVYWGERPRARRGQASTSDFSAAAAGIAMLNLALIGDAHRFKSLVWMRAHAAFSLPGANS